MGKLKTIMSLCGCFVLLTNAQASANLGEIVDRPALMMTFNVLLLLFILAGFFLSSRIRSFLRGGELILGWFLILVSFMFLFVAQVLEFGTYIHIFDISVTAVYFVKLLWIMVLVLGVYFIQKVMS